jgi:ribosomal protein S27E
MKANNRLKIKDGYVALLRCNKGHSGNTQYAHAGKYCECQGCGHFITAEFAKRKQAKLLEHVHAL